MAQELVLITGAASGIGRELARLYLSKGYQVAAVDLNETNLKALSNSEDTDNLRTYVGDVSNSQNLANVLEQVAKTQGKVYIWINNAGIADMDAFKDMSLERFRKVIDVNFMGTVNGTHLALTHMKDPERGKIVNISSLSGVLSAPYMSAYVASKHAVVGFTRSVGEELKQSHSAIEVCLVNPGFVDTPITKQEGYEFPDWFKIWVESPKKVAREIFDGVASGKTEINPTKFAKAMLGLNRVAPKLTSKSSRLVLAESWKELLGLQPIRSSHHSNMRSSSTSAIKSSRSEKKS